MKTQTSIIRSHLLFVFMIVLFASNGLRAESYSIHEIKGEIKEFFKDNFEIPSVGAPNLKVEKSGLSISTSAFLHISQNFGSMKLHSDNLFKDQLDFTHRDHLIYYGLIDTTIKIDLGINLMKFDNNLRSNQNGIISDINIKKYTPAFYAHAEYAPEKGYFSLVTEGSVHNQGESSISDYKFYINLSSNTVVDTEIGFHRFDASWQTLNGDNENMSFKGYYARVTYNF